MPFVNKITNRLKKVTFNQLIKDLHVYLSDCLWLVVGHDK